MKTLPEKYAPEAQDFGALLDMLVGELLLAVTWQKASLLVATYSHPVWRELVQLALSTFLDEENVRAGLIAVQAEDTPQTFSQKLLQAVNQGVAVCVVVGFEHLLQPPEGDDEALAALEDLLEHFLGKRYRLVLLLDESVLMASLEKMPQLWAFRHQAVFFAGCPLPDVLWVPGRVSAPDEPSPAPPQAAFSVKDGLEAWRSGDTESALTHLQQALADARRRDDVSAQVEALTALALVYMSREQYAEALAAYDQIETLSPGATLALGNRGKLYLHLARFQEAEAVFKRMLHKNPHSALAWAGLAEAGLKQGHHEEAIAAYKRAYELMPELESALHGLAQALSQAGWHQEALEAWREMLKRNAALPEVWGGLAETLFASGQWQQAVKAYRQAIDLSPRAAWWRNLAQLYSRLGKSSAALEAYRQALALTQDESARREILEAMQGLQTGELVQRLTQPDETAQPVPAAAETEAAFPWDETASPYALPDSVLDGGGARLDGKRLEMGALEGVASLGEAIRRRAETFLGAHRRG